MKPLLALAAAGLLATQSAQANGNEYGVLVPFNFTATVNFNSNYEEPPVIRGTDISPLTTVSLGNKDLIKLLNASSSFTDYLYWYTSGAENYLPAGTVFYLDLDAGYDNYQSPDYYYGNYSSVVVSNKFGIIPLSYYDPDLETYNYDFMEYDVTGVQGNYGYKESTGADNEKDLVNIQLFFEDYNGGDGNYFGLAGTGSLSLTSSSDSSPTGVGFNVNSLDSYSDYYDEDTYYNNYMFGYDSILTGALSVSTKASGDSGFSDNLPYVSWWND